MSEISIDADRAEMRHRGLRWVFIAALLQPPVHINTLFKWRKRHDYDDSEDDPLREVTDDELDTILLAFIQGQKARGDKLVAGHILALGIRCPRSRRRAAMTRIDAQGNAARVTRKHKRVVYNVFRPHHLWHHDGWHKLTQLCGIVVHGCIDGATRKVIYVRATDNNRADVLLDIFRKASGPSGHNLLPSRLRGDRGGENRRVAEYMIDMRGPGRGSYLVGASWQNQRIESFWRFIRSHCLGYYRELIFAMSRMKPQPTYRSDSLCDTWVFQYLFLDFINEELEEFIEAWNNHSIRTEQGFTPNQLELILTDDFPPPADIDLQDYGVDKDEPDQDGQEKDQVQVYPIKCELNDAKRQLFFAHVPRLTKLVAKSNHVECFTVARKYYIDLLDEQMTQEEEDEEDEEEDDVG